MDDGAPTFLGLPEDGEAASDVVILPLPYELTTSYGQGTAEGPMACLEASAQVEVHEVMLGEDLPAGLAFRTEKPWSSEAGSLLEQLDDMEAFLRPWCAGDVFPMALGGEHGILPPLLAALRDHPALEGDLGRLTVVQIDAHADLRSELDGEPYSHACAAARALDLGVGRLLQVGVRAHSLEEQQRIDQDARITTWFARDVMAPSGGEAHWSSFIEVLKGLEGPVHLTFDIDGLDGTLVPATGTPVPGGLSYWHAVQAIEAVFSAPKATVISADVNEIARQVGTPLTQFTAAMVATKIVGAHVSARRAGRWEKAAAGRAGIGPRCPVIPSPKVLRTDGFKSNSTVRRALTSKDALAAHGQHVVLDLTGYASPGPDEAAWVLSVLEDAVARSGARNVHAHAEVFDGSRSPPGFAAVVLLDESHLSAHCYADRGWLAIDCFTCGGTDAQGIVDDVLNAFMADMPSLVVRQRVVLDRFLHPKEA